MKRARSIRLGDGDIGIQPLITRESKLRRACEELENDLQVLRFRQPAPSCAMMAFTNKRKFIGEESSSQGQLPVVDTANLPDWRREVETKLAIINKTGLQKPLYEPEPAIDAVLEATLRSATYINGGAHAGMPIEEAILHNGTVKGKEVLKRRVDEREIWRLQNNQIFFHVQISCQSDRVISAFIKSRVDATPVPDRYRMNGKQLLDDICANYHCNTQASINSRQSILHAAYLKPGQTATDYCVQIETESRALVVAGVVMDVDNTCLHLLQQALSKSDKYKQFGMTLFLRTGVDLAVTWTAIKEVIRAWDINHRAGASSSVDRSNGRSTFSEGQSRYQMTMGAFERKRQGGRKLFRRDGRSFEPTKSTLPPQRESSNYYSSSAPPRPDSSSERKPFVKKPYGPPRKFKFQRPKSMAVYKPRTIKCYKCGRDDHPTNQCTLNRNFGPPSTNHLFSEISSSGRTVVPNLTAGDDDVDDPTGQAVSYCLGALIFTKDYDGIDESGDASELEDGEIRDVDVDYSLFPSSSSSQSAIEVPFVLSADELSEVLPSMALKRKFEKPDLFASDDDDDEVACINISAVSRFDESYSPVSPAYSPTDVNCHFEAESPVSSPAVFDTSKLIEHCELSPAYLSVIEADLSLLEDYVQNHYYNEFLQASTYMDRRDEIDMLMEYHMLAAREIGMSSLKMQQAIALSRAHHYERSFVPPSPTSDASSCSESSTSSSPIVCLSPEFMAEVYSDYKKMVRHANESRWLDRIDPYAPADDGESAVLQRTMLAAGSRESIPSERIDQVLLLFSEATPAERSTVWREYDTPLRYVSRFDDGVDTDLMELQRESGIVTSEGQCDWSCSPAASNPHGCACLIKHRFRSLNEYREVLRSRLDLEVFSYHSNMELNNQPYLCAHEFPGSHVFRDRLLRAIECAQSRGYKGKFCIKCVRGKRGVFCKHFTMKAEGDPSLMRLRDPRDPKSTKWQRRNRAEPVEALIAVASRKFIYLSILYFSYNLKSSLCAQCMRLMAKTLRCLSTRLKAQLSLLTEITQQLVDYINLTRYHVY
jgi:hypothetical protein